jgi:hypothetical protein
MPKTILATTLLAGLLLTSCGEEFTPPSILENGRVLAYSVDPLELGFGAEVRIERNLWVPPGATVSEDRWRFCPINAGARGGFACASEACLVDLTAEQGGAAVRFDPSQHLLTCAAKLGAEAGGTVAPGGAGAPEETPDSIESIVFHRFTLDSGFTREAVVRVTLWLKGPSPDPNLPPMIKEVRSDDRLLVEGDLSTGVDPDAGFPLSVVVDPASLQTYADGSGSELQEDPFFTFFTTAGRFDAERTDGADNRNVWKPEKLEDFDGKEAEIWIVARDGRGGAAVTGPFRVALPGR